MFKYKFASFCIIAGILLPFVAFIDWVIEQGSWMLPVRAVIVGVGLSAYGRYELNKARRRDALKNLQRPE